MIFGLENVCTNYINIFSLYGVIVYAASFAIVLHSSSSESVPPNRKHMFYGGSRKLAQRYQYSYAAKAAFVELSPSQQPTAQELYDQLSKVPGIKEVKWQSSKNSQGNAGNHECERNVLVVPAVAPNNVLEFEITRNNHMTDPNVPHTVSVCFKEPPRDLVGEAWRILRDVTTGKELLPYHVGKYHRQHVLKWMGDPDLAEGPSSASPQPLVGSSATSQPLVGSSATSQPQLSPNLVQQLRPPEKPPLRPPGFGPMMPDPMVGSSATSQPIAGSNDSTSRAVEPSSASSQPLGNKTTKKIIQTNQNIYRSRRACENAGAGLLCTQSPAKPKKVGLTGAARGVSAGPLSAQPDPTRPGLADYRHTPDQPHQRPCIYILV